MDSLKRKVISELFLAPSVLLPIVGGVSAAVLSWATGGSSYLNGAAIAGILGGIGWGLTRLIFHVERITERILQAEIERQKAEENRRLDALAAKLRMDRDPRTQDYLTLLRSLREDLEQAAKQPGIQFRSAPIREQVGRIFKVAVDQLSYSYRLWELSQQLTGEAREQVLADREQILDEIAQAIDRLRGTVQHFQRLVATSDEQDLRSLNAELEQSLEVARRTEQRMRELDRPEVAYESLLREPH
ncbi:MAG: hypothetical protein D6753_11905 [Planctomycetota bacterium]|nr:MAG: hypothetical protein D6753_11905 [Planctomycetota bacterium]